MNKHSRITYGSILIFVLMVISAMGGMLFGILARTMYKKRFYNTVSKAYGFFDQHGNLRGLLDIECESMANLTFAALANSLGIEKSLFELGHDEKAKTTLQKYDAWQLIKLLGIHPSEIEHNYGLSSEITILAVDDKIPLNKKFEEEIKSLLNEIFADIDISDRGRGVEALSKKLLDMARYPWKMPINDDKQQETTIEFISELEEWKQMFNKYPKHEKKVLDQLKMTMSCHQEVEYINFFLANSYVRRAICAVNGKGEKLHHDDHGYVILSTSDGPDEGGVSKRNRALLRQLCKDIAYDRTEKHDQDSKKILLQEKDGRFFSFSMSAEVIVQVYDKDHENLLNKTRTFIFHDSR